MAPEQFAIFSYHHDGAVGRSRPRVVFCVVTSVAVALASIAVSPAWALAFLVPFIAWFAVPKRLFVGPRYLLCGDQILYYANVVRVSQNRKEGTLTLETATGSRFVLDRRLFSTGARKPEKIEALKEAKFSKVSQKIVDRIRRATPDTVRWW